ncbi:MAG: protein O-mannosyl-transferase family [Gemmatimonadaceae bacterium]
MKLRSAGDTARVNMGAAGALVLFIVYAATLAPDVTFWDAGEFIAAAHSLGIPHPPGTPLYVLMLKAWATIVPLPFAVATNLFSAVATAAAAGLTAHVVQRATRSRTMALSVALATGGMSSVWLSATESEVYAASLALSAAMIWAGDRAGRTSGNQWTYLLAYLIALSVPLHLSALVAAPAAIVLASLTRTGFSRARALLLLGVFVLAMGAGRVSLWLMLLGVVLVVTSEMSRVTHPHAPRFTRAIGVLLVATLAFTAVGFLYLRAQLDPAINQGDSDTWGGLLDTIARRQYAVAPPWPRMAPVWLQIGNLLQYADWQIALSLGPTVYPSILRTLFTLLFLVLGYQGAVAHWRLNQRTWMAVAVLLLCGAFGVVAYLNLHAGPSIGYGVIPDDSVREARERDYFFVLGFWAWGIWAGIGAVAIAQRLGRPAWSGVLLVLFPIALNWRAVSRRAEPERSLPRVFAEAMLESAPRNGVLFVMGDNDSYPLWFAQQVHGVRPDVAVVTVPLLPTQWYREQISRRFQLFDAAGASRYDGKMETAARIAAGARRLGRPVVAAMTMTPDERGQLGSQWTASGIVYVEGSARVDWDASRRIAAMVDGRLGSRAPRDAIDPINAYFRRMLDCPKTLLAAGEAADSTRLDSACNYR